MRRLRTPLIALTSALALTLTLASPADAKWYDARDEGEILSTLEVSDPKLAKDGYSLTWKVRLTCPALDDFVLRTRLIQRDPPSIPALLGDDGGITTEAVETRGVCDKREKVQRFTITLPVERPTVYEFCVDDPTAPSGSCLPSERDIAVADVPMTKTKTATSAIAVLEGDSFRSIYCAAPNCAGPTAPYLRFK